MDHILELISVVYELVVSHKPLREIYVIVILGELICSCNLKMLG